MSKQKILMAVLLLAAGTVLSKPNFVVIMADDLGLGDVSYTGGSIETPHIDQLAENGMIFTDFHSNGAVCSPTRASFLTGRYPHRTGVTSVIFEPKDGKEDHGLAPAEVTFAEVLKSTGYVTALFGKWHIGYMPDHHPVKQGFDEYIGNIGGRIDYFTHTHPRSGFVDWWKGTKAIKEDGYTTHLITRHAVDFIKRRKDEPFCLFVSHTAPHTPLQGPNPDVKLSKEEAYPLMIQEVDRGVGEIVATLKDAGIAENTLIVFTADNGHSKHSPGSALIYRGKKGEIYEGGHRVPTVFSWLGKIEAGTRSEQTTMTFDLMPTMLEFAGVGVSEGVALDGVSLVGNLLEGDRLGDRSLFWDVRGYQAVRSGQWKLILGKKEKIELYDLKVDPGEKNSIAKKHPEKAAELLEAVHKLKKEMGIDGER